MHADEKINMAEKGDLKTLEATSRELRGVGEQISKINAQRIADQTSNPQINQEAHPIAAPVYDHLAVMDQRLARIENAVNDILGRLQMPDLEKYTPDGTQTTTAPASAINDGLNSGSELIASSVRDSPSAPASAEVHTSPSSPSAVLSTASYSYQPLDTTKNEIRILVIHEAESATDKINGELIHLSLDDSSVIIQYVQSYTALSYTWGEPKMDRLIILNGHLFPVTRNLETGLRYMRNARMEEAKGYKTATWNWWWVDQICNTYPTFLP